MSLTIKKMQIKIMMRYYYIPIKINKIISCNSPKCWQKCRKTGSLHNTEEKLK